MIDAFKQYVKDNPGRTENELFSVFRLYDNYTMNEADAREAFEAVMTEPEQPKIFEE